MYGLATNWGYGATYYNPYYVAPTVVATTSTPAYDYSQPIVVNNYVTSDSTSAGGTTNATSDSQATNQATDPAYTKFDEALVMFKAENYRQALSACDEAIAKSPKDPAMHEVRALIQFALGQYQPAAAGLNSLLASAPGMDWTTMSSLYGDIDSYTKQLRNLEQYCRSNTKDASALFVLAYHYLVAGHQDAAVDQLKAVVALQPKDVTAQRMLEALTENDQTSETNSKSAAATADAPASNTSAAKAETTDADAPQTDLVGGWKAVDGKGTINLDITEDFKFTWKASAEGQPAVELKGDIAIEGEMMILNNEKQGNLAGKVTSGGADKFTFVPAGAPSDFKGLVFERTASSK
jgi:tetratricopeptide (TPR) repeat protein